MAHAALARCRGRVDAFLSLRTLLPPPPFSHAPPPCLRPPRPLSSPHPILTPSSPPRPSLPLAQVHYPFENKEVFEESFPADFIAEGIDQTRGWFYTLMVLSTAIFDKPAFKNLICNGLVLAEDGRKMSKRLKNYPPPEDILNSYGADALRLYLINSPVVRADELRFKEAGVMQVLKDVFLPWYHAYRMFVQCATNFEAASGKPFARSQQTALASRNTMDRWILAAANGLVQFTRREVHTANDTLMPPLPSHATPPHTAHGTAHTAHARQRTHAHEHATTLAQRLGR
jgi:cysteinyl-tRNA synthetase